MGTALLEDCKSVFAEAEREAQRFKWIESERAQRDLGEDAIRVWVKQHWSGYLRASWIQHIQGSRLFVEFDTSAFGLLQRSSFGDPLLLDRIVDRLEDGQENLDIILWARAWQMPMEGVLEILEILDVNSCRLSCSFDPANRR